MAHDDLGERLPRQLRLRELRVFLTVLEQRSFRKAAAELHVTQPAITKSIAGLEEMLGVRLVDRVANGVEPTAHGASLAPYARSIFDEIHSAARQLDIVSRGASGTLQVGVVPMPAASFLADAIGRTIRTHRNVFIRVIEARERELADLLRRREIDVAFVRLAQFPAAEDFRIVGLFEETLCVLASRSHRLASALELRWHEVADEPWVLPPTDSIFYQQLRRALERAELAMPRHCVEAASIHVQHAMVLHGSMLSFGLRRGDATPYASDRLVRLPVALPPVTGTIGTVTLRGRDDQPLALRLVEHARAVTAHSAAGAGHVGASH